MFSGFADILGKCCKENVTEMTDIDVHRIVTSKVKLPDTRLPLALLMAFEDLENEIRGDVTLGPTNKQTVVAVASKIAEKLGLAPITGYNDAVEDIFLEFLNTVMGHTISRCDETGLTARFESPILVKNISTKASKTSDIATYRIDMMGSVPGSVVVLDDSRENQRPLSLLV